MFVKHEIRTQLHQVLRAMNLASILFFVKANTEVIVFDLWTTSILRKRIGATLIRFFFFIYHTFICKIYNLMWIIHTLICKFSTLVCKIYSIICKIHTLIWKIHTFTCKLVWNIKIKIVNLALIPSVLSRYPLMFPTLNCNFLKILLISLYVTIHITCIFT